MPTKPNNDAPVIQIRDVSKVYEMGDGTIQVRALDGVSINIHDGEYVAIIGASGSGKSTLMNIIGCLDVPTSGTYHIDGQAVETMSNNRLADIRSRKVGFVFQTHNLLPRLTALANVELPMMYGHWPNRRKRAEDALNLVNLGDRMDHRPTELSGGQQQRVGIARALVKEPSVLLADEPTGNLDTANTAEILNIISDLNHENGITVIVVTHERDVAARADRIITLSDGQVISDETKPSPLMTKGELEGV
ncbi:MAG: ABC transporter ATP-binding protein [Chloroflexi bacterium]|nr:ABC transporter ATP-binding protein [Chloroflexota bacterium]MYK60397.1 ABC transporter ATP-binding protein [Chloroflexota bacterium]